jgi:chromosome partitioning protein
MNFIATYEDIMITAFFNQKGGVSKTATCVLLADYASLKNKKILLVDLDPQATLTKDFDNRSKRDRQPTLNNFFLDKTPLSSIIHQVSENIFILPSSTKMFVVPNIDSTDLVDYSDRIKLLAKDYDLVIVDCPPSLSMFSRLGLMIADRLFMPVEASDDSFESLDDAIETVRRMTPLNPKLANYKVFEGRSKKNRSVDESHREDFRTSLGEKWINHVSVPEVTAFKERLLEKNNFFEKVNHTEINSFFDHLWEKEIFNG